MFYDNYILARKGPLARVWVAAHYDKKLSKAQIYEVNIHDSVAAILSDKMRLALRTSGHLLLGVVRIYSRQIRYLLADCNDAYSKIRLAFRPGIIDLPTVDKETAANAVTFPENFLSFDDSSFDDDQLTDTQLMQRFDLNQGLLEEITLKEKPIQRSDRPNFDDKFGDDDDDDAGFVFPVDISKISAATERSPVHIEDADQPVDVEMMPMDEDQPNMLEKQEEKQEGKIPDEESSPLDLEPIEPPAKKPRREMLPDSSKVAVDPVTELTADQIRNQLSDCSDLIEIRPLAPPTRYHTAMQENGSADFLLSEPLIQFGGSMTSFLREALKTKVIKSRKHDDTTLDLDEPPEEIIPETEMVAEDEEAQMYLGVEVFPQEDGMGHEESLSANPVGDDLPAESPQEFIEDSEESGHRRFSRATSHLLNVVEKTLASEQSVSFLRLTRGLNRQQAAMKFYSLVALIVEGRTVAEQAKPFADISIRLP